MIPPRNSRPFCFASGTTTLIHRLGRARSAGCAKKFPQAQVQVVVASTEGICGRIAGPTIRPGV